jgi:hypothetical protein
MAHATSRADGTVSRGSVLTKSLWLASLVFFVGGDVVTTHVGLATGSVREVGPIAGPLIGSFGISSLVVLKVGILVAAYALWRLAPVRYAVGVPLGLAVGGLLVTFWNAAVLLFVLF